VGDGSLTADSSSSAGGDSVLGGITVVGCEAEGATAVPQTAERPGKKHEELSGSQMISLC